MYCSLAELRQYLGIGVTETGDDALLTVLLDAAQAAVDSHCGRTFEGVSETRYYGKRSWTDLDSRALELDKELLSLATLTNGDTVAYGSSDYRLEPWNASPKRVIRLLNVAPAWTFADDGRVAVTGVWGYSSEAPADVAHATKRLAAYYYRQKDAQVFDVTALPEMGQIILPKGMPADVAVILKPYKRFKGFR